MLDGDEAAVIETPESRQRRGKEGPPVDREQQKVLYKRGTKGWDDQGLGLSTKERETKVPEGEEINGVRV